MPSLGEIRDLAKAHQKRTLTACATHGKRLTSHTSSEGLNMRAVVLKTRSPTTGASGKKCPTKVDVVVVEANINASAVTSLSIPVVNGDGTTQEIRNGSKMYLSCFNCSPDELVFGTTVQIECVKCERFNGKIYFSSRRITVMSSDIYDAMEKMPPTFFHPPALEDAEHANLVLRFRGANPNIDTEMVTESGAYMVFEVPDKISNYLFEKDDVREIGGRCQSFHTGWITGPIPFPLVTHRPFPTRRSRKCRYNAIPNDPKGLQNTTGR